MITILRLKLGDTKDVTVTNLKFTNRKAFVQ